MIMKAYDSIIQEDKSAQEELNNRLTAREITPTEYLKEMENLKTRFKDELHKVFHSEKKKLWEIQEEDKEVQDELCRQLSNKEIPRDVFCDKVEEQDEVFKKEFISIINKWKEQ